ncbi:hypothetical protein O6H91_01G159900 [Diphasiastrum complanatum]|uniref:Uncharacterized protein n=8 Tax=Diphasiastrum complanatum TaxID=34168 RepID=A0ACC2EY43_DIPCM|nr:hypothetical protein O6H91_01G159900 [Diphasiastrum complanatum]KAJ7571336.1 hypothetical protein O6H91_01G159900 [Diphasiastrum complanatum]KAJ7571337.1 hypothetical protein O6H91_01G159900 [Diphasiastrum complanatum]KAJ7571338.1 hypothetical protein O6H91_01G159900 [Diphasiastrum complanatum]KAJ7571339.1 hypothetical protein O6H91_01G159900 [Diphasiastrum complanatum]
MDALRKQATKFREQVAKQQQAVLKQFTGHAIQGSDVIVTDEAELQRHQQLERLYTSTRAGKHFQRDIVRGIEGIVSTGSKQLEFATKLGEDCRKYATEGPSANGALGKTAVHYGNARIQMEKEREGLHRILSTQVAEPLRAMVMGAPLEDARHLAQRYDRLRQEAETQGQEVGRRQLRSKEAGFNPENAVKLQVAEAKMTDLTSAMAVLGKEAAAAMSAVEAQQQRLTLQRLISMVEAERGYHLQVAEILDQLYNQMISERQRGEGLPIQQSGPQIVDTYSPAPSKSNLGSPNQSQSGAQKSMYFLAEVMHPFVAETAGELSLTLGDYVVVRQVSATGWSEGECKGKAGWFPSTYVERRQRGPASKVAEAGSVF